MCSSTFSGYPDRARKRKRSRSGFPSINTAISAVGLADRIAVHQGDGDDILGALPAAEFHVAFFNGFTPTTATIHALRTRLRVVGFLVAANLTLGPDTEVPDGLNDPARWLPADRDCHVPGGRGAWRLAAPHPERLLGTDRRAVCR